MARYRKIDVRIWGDRKVRALTPIPPCGQGLWFYLLFGRETNIIPGIIVGGQATLAESLRWPVEAFREAFGEVFLQGMAKADWEAQMVWVPNAAKFNKPESPNVIRSWADSWDETPECPLKLEAWQTLKAFAEGWGEGFAKAFGEACPKPSGKAWANQEQEQEQEQEQDKRGAPPEAAVEERRPDRPARVGLGCAEGEALNHWRTVAWPKLSSVPPPPATEREVNRLRALCQSPGLPAVKDAMDVAVADEWWSKPGKLDLATFIQHFGKFLTRKAAPPTGYSQVGRVGKFEEEETW